MRLSNETSSEKTAPKNGSMADETANKRTRASGEVLEYLLREFDKNQNPTPDQRKDISERTNMSEKAVRIWFQNRRAKLRKFERMGKPVKGSTNGKNTFNANSSSNNVATGASSTYSGSSIHSSRSNSYTSISALQALSTLPVEVNEKYCFVDCLSLSVGSWQRIKSGEHDTNLSLSLVNLAPYTLNNAMTSVDLMVILSRRNQEINYFFLAVSNNSKILFRIFYPITSIVQCLLLDNNINKESNELRLNLSRKPKFSVFFFDSVNSSLNQWSICDDFSEAQQVSNAYYAPGGTSTPHVLVGPKHALLYLKSFITEHNLVHQQAQANFGHSRVNGSSGLPLRNDTPVSEYNLASVASQFPFDENKEHGDLQIKHEAWETLSDRSFSTQATTARPPFESHPLFQHLAHQANDGSGLAATPDFFSAVQTPGSNMASANANTDDDGLIPSPTAHVKKGRQQDHMSSDGHIHGVHDDESPYAQLSKFLDDYQIQHGLDDHAHDHGAHDDNAYGFDLHQAPNDEFQANDLLVHSPDLASNDTPGASAASQVDTFIDYNSHY